MQFYIMAKTHVRQITLVHVAKCQQQTLWNYNVCSKRQLRSFLGKNVWSHNAVVNPASLVAHWATTGCPLSNELHLNCCINVQTHSNTANILFIRINQQLSAWSQPTRIEPKTTLCYLNLYCLCVSQFSQLAVRIWNNLPIDIQNCDNYCTIRRKLKTIGNDYDCMLMPTNSF